MHLGLSLAITRMFRTSGGGEVVLESALAILASYGADAHLWLPGVGTVSGLSAANFIESNGTSPAAVDGPVGYVGDRYGTLNATQATTASKPILRQSGGLYSWQFDGADTFNLPPVFSGLDPICIVLSGSRDVAAVGETHAFGGKNSDTILGELQLGWVSATGPRFWVKGGGVTTGKSAGGPSLPVGTTGVISGRRDVAGNLVCRVNAVPGVVTTGGNLSLNIPSNTIGSNGGIQFMRGFVGPVIAIKGTVSDADLLTLEKWVGSLSGVSL